MVSPGSDATGRCELCGNDLRAKARFCDACGSPVTPRTASGEHKQVTVLFADVVGSMKLAAALDAERLQEIMNEMFNRAAAVVQRYHGTVDKFTGDGLMALFGAPVAVPYGRDQLEVARRVEVAGCGTRLPVKKLSPARLRTKVREAMTMTDGAERVAAGFKATGGTRRGADLFEQRLLGLDVGRSQQSG
ncbi:MAG TPA: adenylate/guanylate cyclase domain-containing protein [Mycobacterium sp.]|nr:adenylate/guanylate cyclase domain-containing protein [Mycobacterium sp.]HTY33557.1 adenylate/guanylate cyclase domain-containing protein [Mycobacterium sp.]